MRYAIIFLLLFFGICYAGQLHEPVIDRQLSPQTQQYLRNIYDNFNNLKMLTANPNGSINGKYGDIVGAAYGGKFYIFMCVSSPSGTSWQGEELSSTP